MTWILHYDLQTALRIFKSNPGFKNSVLLDNLNYDDLPNILYWVLTDNMLDGIITQNGYYTYSPLFGGVVNINTIRTGHMLSEEFDGQYQAPSSVGSFAAREIRPDMLAKLSRTAKTTVKVDPVVVTRPATTFEPIIKVEPTIILPAQNQPLITKLPPDAVEPKTKKTTGEKLAIVATVVAITGGVAGIFATVNELRKRRE